MVRAGLGYWPADAAACERRHEACATRADRGVMSSRGPRSWRRWGGAARRRRPEPARRDMSIAHGRADRSHRHLLIPGSSLLLANLSSRRAGSYLNSDSTARLRHFPGNHTTPRNRYAG